MAYYLIRTGIYMKRRVTVLVAMNTQLHTQGQIDKAYYLIRTGVHEKKVHPTIKKGGY